MPIEFPPPRVKNAIPGRSNIAHGYQRLRCLQRAFAQRQRALSDLRRAPPVGRVVSAPQLVHSHAHSARSYIVLTVSVIPDEDRMPPQYVRPLTASERQFLKR